MDLFLFYYLTNCSSCSSRSVLGADSHGELSRVEPLALHPFGCWCPAQVSRHWHQGAVQLAKCLIPLTPGGNQVYGGQSKVAALLQIHWEWEGRSRAIVWL